MHLRIHLIIHGYTFYPWKKPPYPWIWLIHGWRATIAALHLHAVVVKKWGRRSSLPRYTLAGEDIKRNLLKETPQNWKFQPWKPHPRITVPWHYPHFRVNLPYSDQDRPTAGPQSVDLRVATAPSIHLPHESKEDFLTATFEVLLGLLQACTVWYGDSTSPLICWIRKQRCGCRTYFTILVRKLGSHLPLL